MRRAGGGRAGPFGDRGEPGELGLLVAGGPLLPAVEGGLVDLGGVGAPGEGQPGQAPRRPGDPDGGYRERQPGERPGVRAVGGVAGECPGRVEDHGEWQQRPGDPQQREPPGPLRLLAPGGELPGDRLRVRPRLGERGDELPPVAEHPAEPRPGSEQHLLGPGDPVVEGGGLHGHGGVVPFAVDVSLAWPPLLESDDAMRCPGLSLFAANRFRSGAALASARQQYLVSLQSIASRFRDPPACRSQFMPAAAGRSHGFRASRYGTG